MLHSIVAIDAHLKARAYIEFPKLKHANEFRATDRYLEPNIQSELVALYIQGF